MRIRFEATSKEYVRRDGGTIRALDGIDLTVAGGEFVAIIGPSGCGKSTLLLLAAGLRRAAASCLTGSAPGGP